MNVAYRMNRLARVKAGLDRTIDDESRRPMPDGTRLTALKRAKLRVNDQLKRLRGFVGEAVEAHAEARRVRRGQKPVPIMVRSSPIA